MPARHRRAPLGGQGTVVIALLLALGAFSLYGLTFGNFVGYESETAAVTEGLVKTGKLVLLPGTTLSNQGFPGPGGRLYSRTGLTQPLLEAPFYAVGEGLDQLATHQRTERWRLFMLRLFNPAMSALTVVAIFGILLLRGIETRRAAALAALAAVGSLIWPYAKVGMETTLMACFAATVLAAIWATRGPAWRWALAGVLAGATAAAVGYGPVLLLALPPLLLEGFGRLVRRHQIQRLVLFAVPLVAWIVAIGWYNHYRTGSITNFDDAYLPGASDAPFAFFGLWISPGKGLLLYSPLAILGLCGLRPMWRQDRALALAVILGLLANTLFIAVKYGWTDDTWGPRYLVPSAWLLLLPLAWWVRGRHRRRILYGVAALAVCVQCVGVFSPYDVDSEIANAYVGAELYFPPVGRPGVIPYGDDGPRWIPNDSPLLSSTEVALAWIKQHVTGSGFVVSYDPIRGRHVSVNLDHPADALGVNLPDFWWSFGGIDPVQEIAAIALALLGLASSLALLRRLRAPPLTAG